MTDYLSLRVNPKLKEEFYSFCKSRGLTAGKAVKLLARNFSNIEKTRLFIDESRRYPDVALTRISIHMDADTRQRFSDACNEYGLPMSVVVRGFMNYCVTNGNFPVGIMGNV